MHMLHNLCPHPLVSLPLQYGVLPLTTEFPFSTCPMDLSLTFWNACDSMYIDYLLDPAQKSNKYNITIVADQHDVV